MNSKQLHQLLNCCRPSHDDLAEPEMRALVEALAGDAELRHQSAELEVWDTQMRAAMHDVPVPSGLAERLLEAAKTRQQQGRTEKTGQDDTGDEDPFGHDLQQTPRDVGGRQTKRWVAVAAFLATVAAAIAIVTWFGPWRDELTGPQVANMARSWMRALDRESWRGTKPPLKMYPIDPSLRFASVRWQRLAALDDRHAVAYQASLPPDGAVAYLLVVRTHRTARLPTTPPMVPQSTTEGLCVGVWQTKGMLYVLAVPGSQNQYRRAINSQSFVLRMVPGRLRLQPKRIPRGIPSQKSIATQSVS